MFPWNPFLSIPCTSRQSPCRDRQSDRTEPSARYGWQTQPALHWCCHPRDPEDGKHCSSQWTQTCQQGHDTRRLLHTQGQFKVTKFIPWKILKNENVLVGLNLWISFFRVHPWCPCWPLCCSTRLNGRLQTASTQDTSWMLRESLWREKLSWPSLQVIQVHLDLEHKNLNQHISWILSSYTFVCICVCGLFRETCVSWRRPRQDGAVPVFGWFATEVLFLRSWWSGVEYRRNNWNYTCTTSLQSLRQGSRLNYATPPRNILHPTNV